MADFTVNKTDNLPVLSWPPGKTFVLKRTVDFSVAANQLVQNGIMALFEIPAYIKVREVGMRVITADADLATSGYLGAYSRVAATSTITAIDADGFGVTGEVMNATGYVAMDVDAAYNPQGTGANGYVATSPWYVTFTNIDTDTINEAEVEFFAICEDLS